MPTSTIQTRTVEKLTAAIDAEMECVKNLKTVIKNHKSTIATLQKVLKTAKKLDDGKAKKKARILKKPAIMPTENDENRPIVKEEEEKTTSLVQAEVEEKVPEISQEQPADEIKTVMENSLPPKKKKKTSPTKKEPEPVLNENMSIATDEKHEGSSSSKKKGKVGAIKPKTEIKQGEADVVVQP